MIKLLRIEGTINDKSTFDGIMSLNIDEFGTVGVFVFFCVDEQGGTVGDFVDHLCAVFEGDGWAT